MTTQERPTPASTPRLERSSAGGRERRADIFERSRAAGGTIEKKIYERVEAALVRSVSGEGATSVISSGAVALGLHLSAPNINTFRYVGGHGVPLQNQGRECGLEPRRRARRAWRLRPQMARTTPRDS